MTASVDVDSLNTKQRELIATFGDAVTDEMLAMYASKPKGRPAKVKNPTPDNIDTQESVNREGRFLLEHLENCNVPFVRKQCGACDQFFLANYKFVAFCSDTCRAAHFYEKYGFVWSAERTENERWEFWKTPPSIVKPDTLKRLEAFARAILEIEPTQEDVALAESTARTHANSVELWNSSTQVQQANGREVSNGKLPTQADKSRRTVPTSGPGIPPPISADKQSAAAAVRARFKAGEITAHELQEELAAVFRA